MSRKKHVPAGQVRAVMCMKKNKQVKVKRKCMAAAASQVAAQEFANKNRQAQR